MPHSQPQSACSQITRRMVERQGSRKAPRFPTLMRLVRWGVVALPWIYALSLLLVWTLLRFLSDRWWFATMMLFGPRWIYPLPLLVLVPLCLLWDRRRWPVLLLGIAILWFPVMDFCLPWGRLFAPAGTRYRVLTCNLHNEECNFDALRTLILREDPDFIALQECSVDAARSVLSGYQVLNSDRLLVASRFPLQAINEISGPEPPHVYPRMHAAFFAADTPTGKLIVGCVHFPSPRYGLSSVLDRQTGVQLSKKELLEENIRLRREESTVVKETLAKFSDPIILAGDFNTPVESAIYHDCWAPYRNAFSRTGFGFGRTFECHVRGIPFGVRIDHILSGPKVTPARCWIGPDVGSEHLPMLADMICE
jgi:vancomycin resistance protein VanJ